VHALAHNSHGAEPSGLTTAIVGKKKRENLIIARAQHFNATHPPAVTCAVRDREFYANLVPFAGGGDLPSDNGAPTQIHKSRTL